MGRSRQSKHLAWLCPNNSVSACSISVVQQDLFEQAFQKRDRERKRERERERERERRVEGEDIYSIMDHVAIG